MEFIDPLDIWKLKNVILSNTSLIDLIKEYGIRLEDKQSGQFTHRTFCPFHKGKNGKTERTPSLFISETTNSFCCFGCAAGSSAIDFVQLMDGTPPTIALTKLAKRIGIIDKDGKWDELKINTLGGVSILEPIKTIEPFLFEISKVLRNYTKLFIDTPEFDIEFKWIEKVSAKVDEFLSNIGYEDWEYAEELCEKVKNSIKNKLRKKDK